MAFVLLVQFFTLAFIFLLIWLTAFRRQNWARWIFVIMFVLGLPAYALTFRTIFDTPVQAGISLFQLALEIASLCFIFSGNAVAWFKRDLA
jgi:hypothetical protein